MVDHAVSAAYQAQALARVVAVEAGPGAVGLGAEAGGAAPSRRQQELQATVGEQPKQVGTRPQYHRPVSASRAASTSGRGFQRAGMRGSLSATIVTRSTAIAAM